MEPLRKMLNTLAFRFRNNTGIGAFVEVLFLLHMNFIWKKEDEYLVLTEDSCSNGDFILTSTVSNVKRIIEVKAFDRRYIEDDMVKIKMSKNPIPDHNWEMILGQVVNAANNQQWVRWYRLKDPQRIRSYNREPDPRSKYKIVIRIPMDDLEEIQVDNVYAIERFKSYISYFHKRQSVNNPKARRRTTSRSTITLDGLSSCGSMYGYYTLSPGHKPSEYRTYAQVLK